VLDDVIGWLRCPSCGAALSRDGGALRCPRRHAFDVARHGYVSLLRPGTKRRPFGVGDTAEMVAARADFLAAGHFAELASAVAGAAAGAAASAGSAGGVPGCVADIGAGTGYYLAAVLDRLPGRAGLALDVSKFALRRAARAHERIGAVGADAWGQLPVADGAAAVVLNVFAPRSGGELRRILHPAGALLVVTPNPEHLGELAGPLRLLAVDPRKDERLAGKLGPYFELREQRQHRFGVRLGHRDVAAAVAMGPSAWHADPGVLADRIRELPDPVPATVSVTLSVYGAARE
jgi:23S rRNA (guanine745-N1)-methyltransferase